MGGFLGETEGMGGNRTDGEGGLVRCTVWGIGFNDMPRFTRHLMPRRGDGA